LYDRKKRSDEETGDGDGRTYLIPRQYSIWPRAKEVGKDPYFFWALTLRHSIHLVVRQKARFPLLAQTRELPGGDWLKIRAYFPFIVNDFGRTL
jgi:hypothetical protein